MNLKVKRAVINELSSWADSLEVEDFKDTHHLTEEESEEALALIDEIIARGL